MARGAVRRHGEALQGTHRKGREPFGDDLGTGHHERTHRGAAERAPRHNHAPRPADRGRKVFVVPRTDDVHTRQSSRHKEAGLAGRVREQMRHTVGRVAEGQRDAVATAQCRGHSRTARRRRVEQDEEELRHTRLEGEGTADDVVDVGNVPRHIRRPGRHTGDTKRRTRQNRRQRHGNSRARGRPSAGTADAHERTTRSREHDQHPVATQYVPRPGELSTGLSTGFPQAVEKPETRTANEQTETLRPRGGSLRTRPRPRRSSPVSNPRRTV